jgi:ArsR family transcriptional regulator
MTQPLLSHHVSKLVAVGLVEVERRHRWAYYSAAPGASDEISAWLTR